MDIIVIAHNIRSTYNVGSIFRTCEGFGVKKLIFSGYTPYPALAADPRLPYIADKLTAQIEKTALGTTNLLSFEHTDDIFQSMEALSNQGYKIVALEQSPQSIKLPDYTPQKKVCLILGEELNGVEASLLTKCDEIIEIPMYGQKESFNVSVATGIALYGLRTKAT